MTRRPSARPPRARPGVRGPSGAPGHAEHHGLRRAGRVVGLVGGGILGVAVLAVGVFPTRFFLDQRAATTEAQERLEVLRAQNEAYEQRIRALQDPEQIERLAREQFNLVMPGEEAYAVLPAPLPPLDLPEVWPFGPVVEPSGVTDAATEELQPGT